MAVTIVETLFQSFDDAVKNTISSGASNLMNTIAPIFSSATCIYFGFKAIGWYKNGTDIPAMEILETFIKCALICFCSFNVGNYLQYIVPSIDGLSADIVALLNNSSTGTTANTIDELITNYMKMIVDFTKTMSFDILDIKISTLFVQFFALLIMLLSGLPFLVLTCATLFCVKIGMSLMLIIGPIFIAFLFFPATRDLFFGWSKLIISFILINVLFSLVITLEINFINDQFIKSPDPSWGVIISMLVCFSTFIYLAKAIPSFAGAIAGSHGASSIGLPGSGTTARAGRLAATGGKKAAVKSVNYIASKFRARFRAG